MCFAANTATVNATRKPDPKTLAPSTTTWTDPKLTGAESGTFGNPPAAPDLTDEAVREARRRQMRMTQTGRGRKSTFLTGPTGVQPMGAKKALLNGSGGY